MLLRSSSTPLISSLLSPFSDSPTRDSDTTSAAAAAKHSVHYHLISSSPNSLSASSGFSKFRRARSESNLQGLADINNNNTEEDDDFLGLRNNNKQKIKSFNHNHHHYHHRSMLRSEPSFCVYSDEADGEDIATHLNRTPTIGDSIDDFGSGAAGNGGGFSFGKKHMVLIEEEKEDEEETRPASPLYLAAGLGIDDDFIGGGGGGDKFDLNLINFDEDGGGEIEEYYKRKLEEYPFHPLILRNYAQLLKKNGNSYEAEEYFYRATLADPNDGEILSLYAKLLWELHRDEDRALHYFERAVQAAPQDSHILAAYASFLWEMDGDGEEDNKTAQIEERVQLNDDNDSASVEEIPVGIQIEAANLNRREENIEDYYKKMIEENPGNAVVLRNYAQFLYESKEDFQGAEEYYSRAIIADPQDGEVKSEYARLVWKLYRDHDKASSYFEQAAQAAPGNSNVLAAYASFLWETEEDEEEEDCARADSSRVTVVHGAMTAINA